MAFFQDDTQSCPVSSTFSCADTHIHAYIYAHEKKKQIQRSHANQMVAAHAFNSNTQAAEASRPEFKASMAYSVNFRIVRDIQRNCLKKPKERENDSDSSG